MADNEHNAREILARAIRANARHPVGLEKHRVWVIAEMLDEKDARIAALEAAVADVKDCEAVQKSPGNADQGEYMRGLANGLILAVHTLERRDGTPDYIDAVLGEVDGGN